VIHEEARAGGRRQQRRLRRRCVRRRERCVILCRGRLRRHGLSGRAHHGRLDKHRLRRRHGRAGHADREDPGPCPGGTCTIKGCPFGAWTCSVPPGVPAGTVIIMVPGGAAIANCLAFRARARLTLLPPLEIWYDVLTRVLGALAPRGWM
jgi:hypothetical protein